MLGALFFWGLWAFFSKLATNHIEPKSALVYYVVGVIIVGIFVGSLIGWRPEVDGRGITYAILSGIAVASGMLLFFFATDVDKLSRTVVMTALYPLVSILLAVFLLNESITAKEGLGMVLAVAALVLFVL